MLRETRREFLSKLGAVATAFGLSTENSSDTKGETSTKNTTEDGFNNTHQSDPVHGQFAMGMMASFKLQSQKNEFGVDLTSPDMARHTDELTDKT